MASLVLKPDPKLDLVLERDIDVPVELAGRRGPRPNT